MAFSDWDSYTGLLHKFGRVVRRPSRTPVATTNSSRGWTEALAGLEDEIEPLSTEERAEAVALVLAELEKEQAH